MLFFPGYNDIITSYRIGRRSEANRNIGSCERKVKVQLPSLKFSLVFPSDFGHTVGTGVRGNDGNNTSSVLTVCGTKYKSGLDVWARCVLLVSAQPSQRQHLSELQVTQTSAA